MTTGSPRRQLVLLVDQSGKGDHRRIQDAIDAAPAASSGNGGSAGCGSVVIRIKPGMYRQAARSFDSGVVYACACMFIINFWSFHMHAEAITSPVLHGYLQRESGGEQAVHNSSRHERQLDRHHLERVLGGL